MSRRSLSPKRAVLLAKSLFSSLNPAELAEALPTTEFAETTPIVVNEEANPVVVGHEFELGNMGTVAPLQAIPDMEEEALLLPTPQVAEVAPTLGGNLAAELDVEMVNYDHPVQAIPDMGEFGCVDCFNPACPGGCLEGLGDSFFPLVIVFGSKSSSAPMRCRFCTGRVAPSPTPLPYLDPVCPRAQRGGSDHRWTSITSPITDYLFLAVRRFWRNPSFGDLNRMASPVVLKNKALLEEWFHDKNVEREIFRKFGTVIRLQFELPFTRK